MKYTTLFLTLLLLLFNTNMVVSQELKLDFNKVNDENYKLIRYWGSSTDTIFGKLDKDGKASVAINNNYRGMVSLVLESGMGFQSIINNEPIVLAKSSEKVINFSTVDFEQSKENSFLKEKYGNLIDYSTKLNLLGSLIQVYGEKSPFTQNNILSEFMSLSKKDSVLVAEINESDSYAAQIIKFKMYLNKFKSASRMSKEQINALSKEASDLDYKKLYSSSLWNEAILNWVVFEHEVVRDPNSFSLTSLETLRNIKEESTRDEYSNTVINVCSQYGWDDLAKLFTTVVINSKTISNPTRNLKRTINAITVSIGSLAPDFPLDGERTLYNTYSKDSVVLFFYESGCDHCQQEIEKLKAYYPTFEKNNIKLITIAYDKTKVEYLFLANYFPWKEHLYDPEAKIFSPYGVFSTPTYFTLKNRVLQGSYTLLEDITREK